MLLLDMTQYKVVKGKRLGSVFVKQFSRAKPGWGLEHYYINQFNQSIL